MDFPILTKLEENIIKGLTQNDVERTITGAVLNHSAGKGYCFLMTLLYGLEEVGGHSLDELVARLKATEFANEIFDKSTGWVEQGDALARIITKGKSGLSRLLMTDNIDVLRNVIYNARPIDKLFIVAKLPGHYIYVRLNGNYSNPLNNVNVATEKVVGWRLWKVLT